MVSVIRGDDNFDSALSGRVLQVVDVQYDTVWSFTNTSYTDTTGFTASITLTSSSNKVLVMGSIFGGISGNGTVLFRLNRNGTAIGENPNNTDGPCFLNSYDAGLSVKQFTRHMLDAPGTSSPVVYQFQHRVSTLTGYINRHVGGSTYGGQSNLTLLEIEA